MNSISTSEVKLQNLDMTIIAFHVYPRALETKFHAQRYVAERPHIFKYLSQRE